MNWTREQKNVTIAAYLGWTLDAFDFFLMVFVLKDIANEFNTKIPAVAFAITLTLAMRPIGALIFGRMADKYGRRPTLMINIACYSLFELLTGFSPNLTTFIVLRALFGVAMGGEWGVGSALTMETIPPRSRGIVSGLLQAGYPSGYLLASLAYGILFPLLGWRGLFMAGLAPALLVLYIRRLVPESPGWSHEHARASSIAATLSRHWRLVVYGVLLMTCFNFFSHGTQDLYPTFLKVDHGFDPHTVSAIQVTYNVGAILGGLVLGTLSQRMGRRRVIVAGALLSLLAISLWAYAETPVMLAIGAFVMQFLVQGCWGIIPAHLNELSPTEARATFPGFVYQLGNFFASINLPLQASLAVSLGSYAAALAAVAASAALGVAIFTFAGREARDVDMQAKPARA